MYNVSFGKITPQAEHTAKMQLLGMQAVAKTFKTEHEYNLLNTALESLERAKNDPDYLFDINQNQKAIITEDGHLGFNDNNTFTMYKIGKGNDRYCYMGKCEFLQDGIKLADTINKLLKQYKKEKDCCGGFEKVIAVKLLNADKSMDYDTAMEAGRKLVDLVG